MQKLGQKTITGSILLRSGMRIGGSDDLLQIGGVDLTSIKHPVTREPYIPGSSFKGKMRSELEKKLGKISGRDSNEPCGCTKQECLICRVFGPHKKANHELGPSRLIVRDAALAVASDFENKTENIIDRKVGSAKHPRTVERVAAGAKFDFKIGIQIWDLDNNCQHKGITGAEALVEFVKDGLRLVQETGLGSGISKGYGEVEFLDLKLDGEEFTL